MRPDNQFGQTEHQPFRADLSDFILLRRDPQTQARRQAPGLPKPAHML